MNLFTITTNRISTFCAMVMCILVELSAASEDFRVGWAAGDITPRSAVAMRGGTISAGVSDPLIATAMALQYENGHHSEGIVLVSCDLQHITDGNRYEADMLGRVRELLCKAVPALRPEKIIMMATHTHVAPAVQSDEQYNQFASERIAQVAQQAWENRKPSLLSYGLGHAVVGHNRIATYTDGNSHMTGSLQRGSTGNPAFSHIEGFEDHSVHLMCTWDDRENLTGIVVNVACPAQVMRGNKLSADYWHDVRKVLRQRLGPHVHILPQISAAGDVATTVMVEKRAEKRMQKLLFPNESDERELRRKQIAERISNAVTSLLPHLKQVAEATPIVVHKMQKLELPGGFPVADPEAPTYPIEIHAVRIGDIAFVTNPFELYVDYGVRIKGRSPAIQTFVIQLAGSGSYLPTQRAVKGGGYGAIARTCVVGPEAGNQLVNATQTILDELWEHAEGER